MKKGVYLFGVFAMMIGILFGGCSNELGIEENPPQEEQQPTEETEDGTGEEETDEETDDVNQLVNETYEVAAERAIHALKDQDMDILAKLAHPSLGIRFSPYGYIDKEHSLVFSSEDVKNLLKDETVYHWGFFDGSGEPIEMTFPDYYRRFIYDVDFANAPEQSVNERLGHGNSLDNSAEFFTDATVIEYYYPGFEQKYEGMDWRSLRLAIKKEGESWYVVGIIHDEWTI